MNPLPPPPPRRSSRSSSSNSSKEQNNSSGEPRFSLRGKLFLLFGFPRRERAQLIDTLERLYATLLGADAAGNGSEEQRVDRSVLYVVANYWAEAAPPTQSRALRAWRDRAPAGGRLELVTRFWVLEMAQLSRWIDPHRHPFFRPPPLSPALEEADPEPEAASARLLTYPIDYKDDVDMEEADALIAASTAQEAGRSQSQSQRTMRLRLPCSPRYALGREQEVPLWPYLFGYLRQPLRSMRDLDAVIRACVRRCEYNRPFNCLEAAIFKLLTFDEQQALFQRALPELAKLVRQLPFLFPTPPSLLTPLVTATTTAAAAVETPNSSSAPASAASAAPNDRAEILSATVSFTKRQILALVSCCFFGIMPEQDRAGSSGNYRASRQQENSASDQSGRQPRVVVEFPHFSMSRMFLSLPMNAGPKVHKLRCVLQYLLSVTKQLVQDRSRLEHEVVTFSRVAVALPQATRAEETEDLEGCGSDDDSDALAETIRARIALLSALRPPQQGQGGRQTLTRLRSQSERLIEDLDAHLQMDFANKYPGGGVLGAGCVQEEIRFVLSPELLVSCLVTAKLEPHEAFAVRGTERYSAYSGYGGSFEMSGPFDDQTPSEDVVHNGSACRRRRCVTVGVDATDYGGDRKGSDRQFSRAHMWRDLLKAFAGFIYGQERDADADDDSAAWPVASGNWGCGVFRGDPELKLLLQWLAASLAGRELVYVLLERDELLKQRLARLTALMARLDWRVTTQWLVDFLFREGGSESLWEMVRQRHNERRRREGLWPRRGRGGVGYTRGRRLGSASSSEDDGGSGVLAMAIEALERELHSQGGADSAYVAAVASAPDGAGLVVGEPTSEDMEVDGGGGTAGTTWTRTSTADQAAPKKQKRCVQSTMDGFFK